MPVLVILTYSYFLKMIPGLKILSVPLSSYRFSVLLLHTSYFCVRNNETYWAILYFYIHTAVLFVFYRAEIKVDILPGI